MAVHAGNSSHSLRIKLRKHCCHDANQDKRLWWSFQARYHSVQCLFRFHTSDRIWTRPRQSFHWDTIQISCFAHVYSLLQPFCLIANSRMNSLIRTAEVLLDIVHQSQVTRTPLSPSEQQAIKGLLVTIKACQKDTTFWIRAVLVLAGCISCLTAFSAAASFWFVAFLSECRCSFFSPPPVARMLTLRLQFQITHHPNLTAVVLHSSMPQQDMKSPS